MSSIKQILSARLTLSQAMVAFLGIVGGSLAAVWWVYTQEQEMFESQPQVPSHEVSPTMPDYGPTDEADREADRQALAEAARMREVVAQEKAKALAKLKAKLLASKKLQEEAEAKVKALNAKIEVAEKKIVQTESKVRELQEVPTVDGADEQLLASIARVRQALEHFKQEREHLEEEQTRSIENQIALEKAIRDIIYSPNYKRTDALIFQYNVR